jgi:hypothetical protein
MATGGNDTTTGGARIEVKRGLNKKDLGLKLKINGNFTKKPQ